MSSSKNAQQHAKAATTTSDGPGSQQIRETGSSFKTRTSSVATIHVNNDATASLLSKTSLTESYRATLSDESSTQYVLREKASLNIIIIW
ncbi:hypothetical protein BJV82DRAFT_322464 [Fennellomyces sp. T-0311]|nr:hypothetical protein BJV82DRAFT_322464 [Fennellomyces sp. T-0311]